MVEWLPWIMWAAFFAWLMFGSGRTTPLTPAERRRAVIIGSAAGAVAVVLTVFSVSTLLRPRLPEPPTQAAPVTAPAPAVPPPVIQPR